MIRFDAGLHQDGPDADKETVYELFAQILPSTQRRRPVWEQLSKLEQEIRDLVQDEKEPMKPKTAHLILKCKHGLKASCESFKPIFYSKPLSQKAKWLCRKYFVPAFSKIVVPININISKISYLHVD